MNASTENLHLKNSTGGNTTVDYFEFNISICALLRDLPIVAVAY
jgi:hypothetical protein